MRCLFRACVCSTFTIAALAGCASYGPQSLRTGASVADVTAAMGSPTGRYARPGGGERFEYARGPYGKHTYMLDFDTQGRLTEWQQVLTEPRFDDIRVGMTRDDILMTLGHPADSRPLSFQHRTLWSYRYEGPFCKWFQVGLDRGDRVVDTGYGPDPLCEEFNFDSGGR
jgi:hypothetical protein